MTERQGHWIIAKNREDLEKKVSELNEYLFDVVLEEDTIEEFYKTIYRFFTSFVKGCITEIRRKFIRAYVHYIV